MTLPQYDVRDPKLEELTAEERYGLHSARLVRMVRYVAQTSPFWAYKLAEAGVDPGEVRDWGDITALPFCDRRQLEAEQATHPPFGRYTCSPPSTWRWFFTTSGTSGRPLRRVLSGRDWNYVMDRFLRKPPVGVDDTVVMLGPTDGLVGPSVAAEYYRRAGALVVHAGRMETAAKIDLVADIQPTVLVGTASYLLHLLDRARERSVDLASSGVRVLKCSGEPGAAIEETAAALRRGYDVSRIDDGYGLTELLPLGGNCPWSTATHVHDDLVAVEAVRPETGEPVPPGEPGELVYTNLVGDTQPVLRYRSGDIGRLSTPGDPCECGATMTRILNGIEGRADEMIWYRGVNFFPSAVESALRGLPIRIGEYRIVLDHSAAVPEMTVELEVDSGAREGVRETVLHGLKQAIGVRPNVALAEPGSIDVTSATTMKINRVVHTGAAGTLQRGSQ